MSARRLRYLPEAQAEYLKQVAYYSERDPKVGATFVASIGQAAQFALGNPEGFPLVEGDPSLRAVVVRRFPFRIFYP